MFAKARTLPIGSVRKHGGSLYKKTAQGWKRVKKKGHTVKDKLTIEKKKKLGMMSITESHKQGAYVSIGNSIDYMGLKKTKESIERSLKVNDFSTNASVHYFYKFKLYVINDIIKKGNKSPYKKKVDVAWKANAKVVMEARRGEKAVEKEKAKMLPEFSKDEIKNYSKTFSVEKKKPSDTYTKILNRQKEMDKKYAPLKGMKIKTVDGQEWEFQKTNDIGVPYFSMVKGKTTQKKQFTLAQYGKEWANEILSKLQTIKKTPRQASKARVKTRVKSKTVKQPTKKKTTLRTVTEQYQDKIKKLSIMNKPGRLIFKKMIQQAIKDKAKKQLKLIFEDIDSWLLRNKTFKKKKNIRKER